MGAGELAYWICTAYGIIQLYSYDTYHAAYDLYGSRNRAVSRV